MDKPEDVTGEMKSLQVQDTSANPQGQEAQKSTEDQPGSGKDVASGSTTSKSKADKASSEFSADSKDEVGAVAEARASASGIQEKKDEEQGSGKKKRKRKKTKKKTDEEQLGEAPAAVAKSAEVQQTSDQKEGNLHTGYILDRHARNRELSEAAKFFLQSLDEKSTESEPSLEARYQGIVNCVPLEDIMKQLWLKIKNRRITVLHGPEGCGKTTTALLLTQFMLTLTTMNVHWCEPSTLAGCFEDQQRRETFFVFDNFLGHTSLDSYDKWKVVYNDLRMTMDKNVHILLVTRTSILQQALALTGADFADILNRTTRVELSVNYEAIFENMLPGERTRPWNFNAIPDIGFPVCCKLAYSMPAGKDMEIFKGPRAALHSFVEEEIQKSIPLLSLSLLAITDGYVDARELRSTSRLQNSKYLAVLQSIKAGEVDMEDLSQILDFYNENQNLVQVDDDFVSFINEAVREEVLCVLCMSHAEFLAKHCSLRLLSRLALVTRDPEQKGVYDKKPNLPPTASKHFLQRVLDEMNRCNHREALPSALFEHSSFQTDFLATELDDSLMKKWLRSTDTTGLHFLFWACACESVIQRFVSCKEKISNDVVCQGLVGSCYWGCKNVLNKLLSKKNQDGKSGLCNSKIKDLYKGNKDVKWEKAPFCPEDTLLTLAAWRGKDDVVKELVAMGANVNATGHNSLTALMHYCAQGNADMVTFLLQKAALVHVQDDLGNTALHYALLGGLKSIPNELFHDESLQLENREHKTPWIVACGIGAPRDTLEQLRLRTQKKNLYSCLVAACKAGQTDVVKYLFDIQNKTDVILHNEDGLDAIDPMVGALESGNADEIINFLLPNLKCRENIQELRTLCIRFCEYHDATIVKQFLPFVKNHLDCEALLLLACSMGNRNVVQCLIKTEDLQIDEVSVLKAATSLGSWDFMKWVLDMKKFQMTIEVIFHAIKCHHTELVKQLLPRCHTASNRYFRCLAEAASHNLVPLIKWLLDKQCKKVVVKDKGGSAWILGIERAVKCLIAYGADLQKTARDDLLV